MIIKKPPIKPTNLREYECDLVIDGQYFTKLEISPYYEKHNQEYLDALARKGIKLIPELAEKLISDDLIRKVLVPQLVSKEEIRIDSRYYQYTYYYYVPLYSNNKAYKL